MKPEAENNEFHEDNIWLNRIMINDLKLLELFVRAAHLGAIGKAGAEFGLSPTSATQRIQALEAEVGAQLLHRTTRKVSVTPEGERLLKHAERILESVRDAMMDVTGDDQALTGTLRLAGPASFGRKVIAPLLTKFLSIHQDLTVQLHLSDTVFDIVDNGFDCSIRLGDLNNSTLMAQKLAPCRRVLVAAPGYIAERGAPRTPGDLAQHDCIIRDTAQNWRFKGPDGQSAAAKVTGRFATNLAEAVTEAALSGFGIARKCAWEIADQLESGDLVTVLDEYTVNPEWNIYMMRPPSALEPRRVQAFRAFIKQEMGNLPSLAP